jgi:hypothetical protein
MAAPQKVVAKVRLVNNFKVNQIPLYARAVVASGGCS